MSEAVPSWMSASKNSFLSTASVPTTSQYTVPGPFKVKVAEGAEVD